MSAATAVSIGQQSVVSPEDQARAQWYLFIAAVLRSPPDEAALRSLRDTALRRDSDAETDSPLGAAWVALLEAARRFELAQIRAEYDDAFIGVGKSEVTLNASWYLTGFLNERPLVDLREQLAKLGLARRDGIGETEDHIASLCEAMAWMIASGESRLGVAVQRDFFGRFIAPWYPRLADSMQGSATTAFYRAVAEVLRVFFDVERQAFDFEA